VPFLLEAGGPAFLASARPFLLSSALLSVALGFYRLWRAGQSNLWPHGLSMLLRWFSVVALLAPVLFPQTIANILADASQGAI
jgi:hypothetical protein